MNFDIWILDLPAYGGLGGIMRVIIVGASGHGKVVLDTLLKSDQKVYGFLDDDKDKQNRSIHNVKVLGTLVDIDKFSEKLPMGTLVAIGNNFERKKVFLRLKELGFTLIKAISPQSYVFDKNKIGEGSLVMPKAVVNIDAEVGENCIINTGAVIEHDCKIGDHSHISSLACLTGGVEVSEEVLIGAGSVILPKIKIGRGAVVGAGAVVIENVPEYSVVVGNPAKIIKKGNRA